MASNVMDVLFCDTPGTELEFGEEWLTLLMQKCAARLKYNPVVFGGKE